MNESVTPTRRPQSQPYTSVKVANINLSDAKKVPFKSEVKQTEAKGTLLQCYSYSELVPFKTCDLVNSSASAKVLQVNRSHNLSDLSFSKGKE